MPINAATIKLKAILNAYVSPSGKTFTVRDYNSLEEFNAYITGNSYNLDICFGIDLTNTGLDYHARLMFNTTNRKITSLITIS